MKTGGRAHFGRQQRYRLPTDEEWSQAVEAAEIKFPWGNLSASACRHRQLRQLDHRRQHG